jgi:hypothetical protein
MTQQFSAAYVFCEKRHIQNAAEARAQSTPETPLLTFLGQHSGHYQVLRTASFLPRSALRQLALCLLAHILEQWVVLDKVFFGAGVPSRSVENVLREGQLFRRLVQFRHEVCESRVGVVRSLEFVHACFGFERLLVRSDGYLWLSILVACCAANLTWVNCGNLCRRGPWVRKLYWTHKHTVSTKFVPARKGSLPGHSAMNRQCCCSSLTDRKPALNTCPLLRL